MNIFVIGSGTFGTAISNELANNKSNNVVLFSRSLNKVNEINNNHTNKKYFPNKKLNTLLQSTNIHSEIIKADVIFIALPSSILKDGINDFRNYISKNQLVVNLSKGIFKDGYTIVDFLSEFLDSENIVCLKGPSFAVEIMEHANTLLTLGYSNKNQKDLVSKIFLDTNIHFDSTKDIRGVEILSVIKNIYALLIGVIDAKYNSPNTRFMFLTKAFTEIRILNKEFQGDLDTLFLSCGLGDLCLTSLNDLSRNRTLGLLIGKGFYNPNSKENTVIIEGLDAVNIIFSLIDEALIYKLPFLMKLHSFFNSNKKSFIVDFNEFIDN
tara:strand:- start:1022 stop:1993 length:972 start_codon:yes stop_codon:yes gene_type:complete